MRFSKKLFFIVLIIFGQALVPIHAQDIDENSPEIKEIFRIKLENVAKGNIYTSTDQGKTWDQIGQVRVPITKVNPKGFSASRFGEIGKVTAVAVNGIHIKTGMNPSSNTGVLFSVLPDNVDVKGRSYYDAPSSIQTAGSPQLGIFGGPWTPLVGSPVYIEQEDGSLVFLPPNYVPKLKDKLIIIVLLPQPYPQEIIFENSFGGKVTVHYQNGEKKVIGQVLKPVQGVGRFIGSQYSGLSRVRANHSGVIDVSTSLGHGKTGGFQIIPAQHAMDPEMEKARTSTQWLVVGPLTQDDPALEGTAPLFDYFIRPTYSEKDLEDQDWQNKLLTRTLVQIKVKGREEWQTLPSFSYDPEKPLPEGAGTALKDIVEIKIVFPM